MTSPSSALPFVFVDYSVDPVQQLAEGIFALGKKDVHDITIWCESRAGIPSVRLSLVNEAHTRHIRGFKLPDICTLQDWVWQQATPKDVIVNETHKQLILVDAIRQKAGLFQSNNAWALAAELTNLFNECTLAQIPLEQGEEYFHELLTRGYGLPKQQSHSTSRESEIVYQLWLAYQQQLSARHLLDPVAYYCQWLAEQQIDVKDQLYYVVGKHRIYAAEAIFFNQIRHSLGIYYPRIAANNFATAYHPHAKVTLLTDNENHDSIDIIFSNTMDALEKTKQLQTTRMHDDFFSRLGLYATHSTEKHVRAVCLQAKRWLLQGKYPIGIIANDRLLIRRIRAVLEAEGIRANDLGGWAFSTTCAATSIETLLDAIENNFQKDLLLDLISSPFIALMQTPECADQVHRFRDLLQQHRNLMSGNLNRLIELASDHDIDMHALVSTLTTLKEAHESQLKSLKYNDHSLQAFTFALLSVMEALGMKSCLQEDVAGEQLLEIIESAINSTRNNDIKISWPEWRQWLKNLLEHNYFMPADTDARVTLCGFEHIDNTNFDYVILAGVEETRLLSTKPKNTFFNEKVRYELNLNTYQQINSINFIRFRQLIERSKFCLLTAETEMHGETQELCSWVKLLELYSAQAFGHSLQSNDLHQLLNSYQAFRDEQIDQGEPSAALPAPSALADLVPLTISASQYQTLVNCPYQYFARYILGLKETDTEDEFDASDYGLLVHRTLERFHFDNRGEKAIDLSTQDRNHLIDKLTKHSMLTFSNTSFPNSVTQGWLQRWITNIPAYIDWVMARNEEWTPVLGEQQLSRPFNDTITLEGRIDRIDAHLNHHAVIDYKSGGLPSDKQVKAGEAVQLPFYALLDPDVTRAEYLELAKQGAVSSRSVLEGEDLEALKNQNAERLGRLVENITSNARLPANGQDAECRYCDYEGLCRKSHWGETLS